MYPLLSPPPPHFYIFSKKTLFIAYLRHDKYFKYNLFFAIEKCINTECPCNVTNGHSQSVIPITYY